MLRAAVVVPLVSLMLLAALPSPPPGPFCTGQEVGFTKREAMTEILGLWCSFREDFPDCVEFTVSNWCPADSCDRILCGTQLDTHASCVSDTAQTEEVSQPCLDFYTAIGS